MPTPTQTQTSEDDVEDQLSDAETLKRTKNSRIIDPSDGIQEEEEAALGAGVAGVASVVSDLEDSFEEKAKIDLGEDALDFIEDIDSGAADTDPDFPARLRASSGVARNPDGTPLRRTQPGDRFETAISERRQLTAEQRGLLEEVRTEIVSIRRSLPEAISRQLRVLNLETIDTLIAETNEDRAQSQVAADIERFDQTVQNLEKLKKFVEQSELATDFSAALFEGGVVKDAIEVLGEAELDSSEDLPFVRYLRPYIGDLVIEQSAGAVLEDTDAFSSSSEDLDKILETLGSSAEYYRDGDTKEKVRSVVRFIQRRQLTEDFITVFDGIELDDLDYKQRSEELKELKRRPTGESFDYNTERTRLQSIGESVLIKARKAEILKAFGNESIGTNELVDQILGLPGVELEDIQLKEQLLENLFLYIVARRKDRPESFTYLFQGLSEEAKQRLQPEFPKSLELGRNLRTAKHLARRFKRTIAVLFESMRGDERTREDTTRYIRAGSSKERGRESYIIDTENLSRQRELTAIEQEYLDSVEALSIFNPHIVAIARENPEVARVFMQNYFIEQSRSTESRLEDGVYFPMLFVGTGPNGVAGMAEIARINPALLEQALVIDSAAMPGGPFAVPEGVAWLLNSANAKGTQGIVLGDSPVTLESQTGIPEEQTVRAYGGPAAREPGSREDGEDVRVGDINTMADYLARLSDIDNGEYANNDQLALLAQLQAALLVQNIALKTEVITVEPSDDDTLPGSKTVTLRITGYGGEPREVKVQTDSLVVASGLGEPTYGFDIKGSRAERVLDAVDGQPETEFPLLSDTLTAFEALASKEAEQKTLGEEIIIYGAGNSTDVLVEYIGGLFEGAENEQIRKVKKIVIVTTGKGFSERKRYAMNQDLAKKGARPNLVEFITVDGVSDVDFVAGSNGKKVTVLDQSGKVPVDSDGEKIEADAIIAATGFRSDLDSVFSAYLGEGETLDQRRDEGDGSKRRKVTLPTNPDVAVADTLADDPSVIFIGTASRPLFNDAKFQQLPPEAREALIRNGAENAVAIGFRRPDDQAAMRLFIPELLRTIEIAESTPGLSTAIEVDDGQGRIAVGSKTVIIPPSEEELLSVRRDVHADSQVLTPLFLFGLDRFRLGHVEQGVREYEFELMPREDGSFSLEYVSGPQGEGAQISSGLLERVTAALDTPKFWGYAIKAAKTRRKWKGYTINVRFKNGVLDLKNTFVQSI